MKQTTISTSLNNIKSQLIKIANNIINHLSENSNDTSSIIFRNSAICLLCGDSVESIHRHDYRSCSCGNISVDGGTSYLRRSFVKADKYIDTSIVATIHIPSYIKESITIEEPIVISSSTNGSNIKFHLYYNRNSNNLSVQKVI